MMARSPRVVAELGRPETPEETATRKAEFSQAYRSSQTTRNLIAALLATLGVLIVIIFAVPRGGVPAAEPVDVPAVATRISDSEARTVIVPAVPEQWLANRASVEGDSVRAWTIVYVPHEASGYLRIAQGFDADAAWPTRVLQGADVADTMTIDGVEWDVYDIPDPARAGNVSVALSTQAGTDTVMIYGTADDETLRTAAEAVAADIRTLAEEQR